MKKKFLGKVLMMASFVAILGGFSSCQDYSEEIYSDVLNKLEIQNTSLESALEAQKQSLEAKLAELQAAQQECQKECAEKMRALENWNAELAAQVASLQAKDEELGKQITAINSVIGDASALEGKTIIEKIVEFNKVAAAVNDSIMGWGSRLTKVEKDAAAAMSLATENKKTIEYLDSIAKAHGEQIDSLKALKNSVDSIQAQAEENLKAAKKYADDQADSLKNEMLDSLNQLTEAMASVDSVLADRLDSVEARVDSLEAQVAKNTKAIENLTGALKKLVTSVVLQGTKNPVMGSIATPFNTRSNILAAYYGSVESQGLEFPTARPRFYVDAANVQLTAKDIEILGAEAVTKNAGVVLLGDEGNAGTLYMTINPNTVDFTGINVALVNSQDELSGATLSAPVLSDEVLSFGITRAANNGFYESKATISEEDLEDVKFTLNLNEVKEVAKDLVNGNGFNVTQLANTVANTMNSFVMDANGVKVSWQDYEGEHSTYSQYGVAVTAIKPLSYSFGSDFAFTNVPGVEQVENFIGKMLDKTVAKLNSVMDDFTGLEFSVPEIKEIKIDELNPDSFKITINIIDTVEYTLNMSVPVDSVEIKSMNGKTDSVVVPVPEKTHEVWNATVGRFEKITIPKYTITVPSSNFTVDGQWVHINDVQINKVLEIPVSFTHVEDIYPIINDLYGNIVGPIEDVNVMLKDLESFMDDVNKMLDELNKIKDITAKVEDASNTLKSQISKFLDYFNDKFCTLVNSTNKVLRPVMLVNTDKGVVKPSQAKNNPTVITGTELELIPTSYSMEYIAPAYKKLVGVTDVFKGNASAQAGDAACMAALDKVNGQEGVAEVLAGDTYTVSATFEAGYIYEVVYTSVDFYGKVDAKKYYVTVK